MANCEVRLLLQHDPRTNRRPRSTLIECHLLAKHHSGPAEQSIRALLCRRSLALFRKSSQSGQKNDIYAAGREPLPFTC